MVTNSEDQQRRLLVFIAVYTKTHGRPPSITEMRNECKISSKGAVFNRLNMLRRKGLLVWDENQHRTWKVVRLDTFKETANEYYGQFGQRDA